MRCAVDGIGLVSHLESVVRPWIERSEVKTVLDKYSVATPGFFLYFPARSQVLPKLRAFIDYARESLGSGLDSANNVSPEKSEAKPRWKWDPASKQPRRLA
jgi:DNA-binding transcriptional LysR family regulator